MSAKTLFSRIFRAAAAVGAGAGPLGWTAAPTQAFAGGTTTSCSGEATVVRGAFSNSLGLAPVTISDTGPLPSSGGALQASLIAEDFAGMLSVHVCPAATIGQDDDVHSEASCADLNLTPGPGNIIQADALFAKAQASCCTDPSVSGPADIANLVVNGTPVTVSGQPNQTVSIVGGEVVINEQNISQDSDSASITANALRVIINGAPSAPTDPTQPDIIHENSTNNGIEGILL
ncbi:MAG: hypothetical protein KGJ60_13280 [Verrucomicrobiota bacterium]|nr:hypothetical protein [Verrucomicrobiota bacterium]